MEKNEFTQLKSWSEIVRAKSCSHWCGMKETCFSSEKRTMCSPYDGRTLTESCTSLGKGSLHVPHKIGCGAFSTRATAPIEENCMDPFWTRSLRPRLRRHRPGDRPGAAGGHPEHKEVRPGWFKSPEVQHPKYIDLVVR